MSGKHSKKEQKTTARKIGGVFSTLFFMLAIAVVIVTAITVIGAKDDPKNAFILGYKPAIVATGSMSPYIKQDTLMVIKKADFAQIKPGDVITYELNGKFITHRAVAVEGDQVTVKGDANPTPDFAPVTAKNFVGVEALRMNWTQPIILDFKTDAKGAALRYIALPVAVIIALYVIFRVTARLLRSGSQESPKTESTEG